MEELGAILDRQFLTPIEEMLAQAPPAGSAGFFELFALERRFHAVLVASRFYQELAVQYLRSEAGLALQTRSHRAMDQVTFLNELTSSKVIISLLERLEERERESFLLDMGRPGTDFESQLVNMERIPQLACEVVSAGIGAGSKLVVIGCGPFPLTGIYYAITGAEVVIVDRVAAAFDAARPLFDLLPAPVRDRISCKLIDGSTLELTEHAPTHVLVSGLTEGKAKVLANLASIRWPCPPTVLLRRPPANLLQLYYYPVADEAFVGFEQQGVVDIGVEGYNITHILRPCGGRLCAA